MAATDFKCELSWSASRAREFQRCRRENWFARYASWGWWKEEPRGRKYEVMVHKNLTSLAACAGDCVHQAISRWFDLRRAGTAMNAAELFEEARDRFRSGWRQSSTDDWKRRPNKSVHLEEHHYGAPPPKERTDAIRERMQACARNFVESPELKAVRESQPDTWLGVEEMDTYLFMGTKVYAVPDFAMHDGTKIHIYDWKTGRPSQDDVFQLHTYALYACEKWQADPEAIMLHAAYLSEGEVRSEPVEIGRLSAAQDRMSESLRAMMDAHFDPDEDETVMADWPPSGAPEACPRCRFRGICDAAPPA